MIHNDVLRSVRYMLDISDNKMVEIIKLGGMDVTKEDLLTTSRKTRKKASYAARTRSWRTSSTAW
jgi:uncharacterized protein YehS (DUF1456 family)